MERNALLHGLLVPGIIPKNGKMGCAQLEPRFFPFFTLNIFAIFDAFRLKKIINYSKKEKKKNSL